MALCLVCGREMAQRWQARDHARGQNGPEYGVLWCRTCGYGRVAGEFAPEDVAGFYGQSYYTHSAPGAEQEAAHGWLNRLRMHLAWRADHGLDLAADEVQATDAHPRLCDVGCGNGKAMGMFHAAGYEAVGIEPDPEARAIASRYGRVYEGTAEWLPEEVEQRQFEVVLLSHVLEHCIDPIAALKNVRSLLSPEGTAIVEVPNNAALALEMFGPAWFFADIPRHLHFFTENSLREVMGQAGLRVTETFYTGYTRQFSQSWLAAQRQVATNLGVQPAPHGEGAQWRLLARTALASPERKYDSIRVHAVAAEG